MDDCVYRQAAIKAVYSIAPIDTELDGTMLARIDVRYVLESLPSADVETVRHGRWIFSPDNAEGTCTYCSGKIYGRPYNNTYVIVPYKYCPHCGARMDVKKNETD